MATEQDIRDLIAIARQAFLQSYSQAPDYGIAIQRSPGEIFLPQLPPFGSGGVTFGILENDTAIVSKQTYDNYEDYTGGPFVVTVINPETNQISTETRTDLAAFGALPEMQKAYFYHDKRYREAYYETFPMPDYEPDRYWTAEEYRRAKGTADAQLVQDLLEAPLPPGLDPVTVVWTQVYRVLSIGLFAGVMPLVHGFRQRLGELLGKDDAPLTEIGEVADATLVSIKEEFARSGALEDIDSRAAFEMKPGETIGFVFGTSLANAIGSDDPWANIAESAVLGTIGQNVGSIADGATRSLLGDADLAQLGLGAIARDAIGDVLPELSQNIVLSTAGALSAYLTAELVDTLGIEGLAGEVLASAAGSGITTIITGIATGAISDALKNLGGNAVLSVGSFFGSKLATELVETETNLGAIGGQIGGSVGATIGNIVVNAIFAAPPIGLFGAFLASFLGGFFGQILGGLLGDLLGDPPEAWAAIEYNRETQRFEVGAARSDNGGSEEVARQLASGVVGQLNALIGAIGAYNILIDIEGVEIGYVGEDLKFRPSSAGPVRSWNDAGDALTDGVLDLLERMTFEGGDPYVKRALAGTTPLLRTSPTQFVDGALSALTGAVLVAGSFESYRNDKLFINALMSDQPDSAFALAWAASLLNAQALGVDRRHEGDWYGGWSVFLAQKELDPEDGVFSLVNDERRIASVGGAAGSFVWVDSIDPTQKTRIEATGDGVRLEVEDVLEAAALRISGTASVTVNGDALAGDVGLSVAAHLIGTDDGDRLGGGDQGNDLEGGGGDDLIFGGELDDWAFGGDGDDNIDVGNGNGDYVSGGDGRDRIGLGLGSGVSDAGAGDDLIADRGGDDFHRGGTGDDEIRDRQGADTYLYDRGDGVDRVHDSGAPSDPDILRLGADILPSDVTVRFDSHTDSLTLVVGPGDGDEIRLSGQAARRSGGVEQVVFSNGVVWDRADLLSLAGAVSGLTPTGTSGADSLIGGSGDDLLDGDVGADTLTGGIGSDTYHFDLGDGSDVIIEAGWDSDIDVVELGSGLTTANTRVTRSSTDDLLITFTGSSESILVTDHWLGGTSGVEELRFADGTVWTRRDLEKTYLTQTATASADVMDAFETDGTVAGGNGNDDLAGSGGYHVLDGGSGSDTFRFNIGDGIVRLLAGSTSDTEKLVFGAGIRPEDVRVYINPAAPADDLEMRVGWGGDLVLLNDYLSPGTLDTIEFANSTVWTLTDVVALAGAQAKNASDNEIIGSRSDDPLAGGKGADKLDGLSGADTYAFDLGDGHDWIDDSHASLTHVDALVLGAGIAPGDVKVRHHPTIASALLLTINGTSDTIQLSRATAVNGEGVEEVRFAGGTVWTRAQLLTFADANIGLSGDDSASNAAGAHTFDLGAGDDNVTGNTNGSDTYKFGRGDGDDLYAEGGGHVNDVDRLVFDDATIKPSDIRLSATSDGDMIVTIAGTADSIQLIDQEGRFTGVEAFDFEDGTTWNKRQIWQHYLDQASTAGDDYIRLGNEDGLIVRPGAGDDYLYDALGTANRTHTIEFAKGDGRDQFDVNIHVSSFTLIKIFGYTAEELRSTATSSSDLMLGFDGSSDSILMLGGGSLAQYDLWALEFEDGTMLSASAIDALATRTKTGGELIQGTSSRDNLFGTTGTDELWGRGGDDLLNGGGGSDLYRFGRGEGSVRIADNGPTGDTDRLTFAAGVATSDILILQSPSDANDLIVTIRGTDDQIYLDDQLAGDGLEEIAFSGGTVWNRAQIVAGSLSAQATSGSDALIVGTVGADALAGLAGDDRLEGGEGSDTYSYSLSHGHDVIADIGSDGDADVLTFGASILLADITASWDGADLVLTLAQGGSVRLVQQGQPRHGIESVAFDGGPVWDAADLLQAVVDVQSTAGDDEVVGGAFAEMLQGGTGADLLHGGGGSDVYLYSSGDGADSIVDNGAASDTDVLRFGSGITPGSLDIVRSATDRSLWTVVLGGGDSVTLRQGSAGEGVEQIEFNGGPTWTRADLQTAYAAQAATSGADVLYGADGEDSLSGGDGADSLFGETGDDTLSGGLGADELHGDDGDDTLTGGDGDDVLIGGAGVDDYDGGLGVDAADFSESFASWTVDLSLGTAVTLAGVTETLTAIENLVGGQRNDTLIGDGGVNVLDGQAGDDALQGGGGADRLDGGVGDDTMTGGLGDDTYVLSSVADVVVEAASEGVDLVETAAVNVSLAAWEHVENATLLGARALNATGNAAGNALTGNDGANRLDGGAGADTMIGGLGNDVFVVDDVSDVVTEAASAGTDAVEAGISYSIAAAPNLENITLTGSANINATGNEGANVLLGNTGANRLDGGLGADTMTGGAGDDVFVVDNVSDVVNESASEGTDTVESSITYTIASMANVENVTLTGAGAINATGNDGSNILIGNTAANTLSGGLGADRLDGGTGADSMTGGSGDDVFVVDDVGDVVTEALNGGSDRIESYITLSIASLTRVENLTLIGAAAINGTGNGNANTLIGNGAANTLDGGGSADRLDGGAGADTMIGGSGDDVIVVDDAGDIVTEASSGGTDTVESFITFSIASLANVEHVTLKGAAAIDATGNTGANTLTGNSAVNALNGGSGADRLDGGAGADTMTGGIGNDVFVVDDAGDVVTEAASEGTDTVEAGITYSIASLANVEHVTLTGTGAINATGNSSANTLIGNSSANRLDGGVGADTMTGGGGNDVFVVDDAGDVVNESASQGSDTVESSLTYSIASLANVENVTLTGAGAINATGNAGANALTGNDQANSLTGGAGNDAIDGAAGDDTAVFAGTYASHSITTVGGSIQIVDNDPSTNGNDGTDTLIGVEHAQFSDQTVNLSLPIVLDLDGDGVELTRWDERSVYFDWNGDGVKDRTGWFGAGDAVLAIDRNHDGRMSGAAELSFVNDAPGAASDLDGLRAYDTNADSVLDAADAGWSQFYVWQDADGDAAVDDGEWRTLADQGVATLDLQGSATSSTWADRENIVVNTGGYVTASGEQRGFADAAFVYELGASPAPAGRAFVRRGGPRAGWHASVAELLRRSSADDPSHRSATVFQAREVAKMIEAMAAFGAKAPADLERDRWTGVRSRETILAPPDLR